MLKLKLCSMEYWIAGSTNAQVEVMFNGILAGNTNAQVVMLNGILESGKRQCSS